MFSARITSPKKIEINEIDIPQIHEGQCLIKLERWSVCGSDIRHNYGPVLPEEEYPMKDGGPCHECAGTIVESKSEKFEVGQRVIVLPDLDGPGGLVEYYPGNEGRMALVPDYGDLGEWVLCQPSGTVLFMSTNGNNPWKRRRNYGAGEHRIIVYSNSIESRR